MTQRTKIIVISIVVIVLLLQLGGSFQMFRLQFKSPIEKKFAYYIECKKYESDCIYLPIKFINEIKYIDNLKEFYEKDNSNSDLLWNGIYLTIGQQVDVLEYDKEENIAFIRIYNRTPRLIKEGTVIVSMNCLHDTLPEELKTTQTLP